MSHEISPSTQQPYGIARVTRLWQGPRSTVYARRARRDHPTCEAKRGPKTRWTAAELTARIRTILAESPFHGEGHIVSSGRACGRRACVPRNGARWL